MTDYQNRKELAITGTCDDFREALDNVPPALWVKLRERLKAIMSKNIDQHLKPYIDDLTAGGSGAGSTIDTSKFASSVSSGKGRGTNAMLVAWNEWKAQPGNDAKQKFGDKSAWDHWKAEIWGKMSDEEKKPYQDKATAQKTAATKGGSGEQKERKTPSVSAFKLFQEKHRKYYDPKEKFTDPSSNAKVGGYALTQKIWSNRVKEDKEMVAHFEKLKKEIDAGEIDQEKGLERLPHIDFDLVRNDGWAYADLNLVD